MFWWMAQNTLIASALAVIVVLACRWGRFSPAVRHALWLVVLIKLVTPPIVRCPSPLGASPLAASWLERLAAWAPLQSKQSAAEPMDRVPVSARKGSSISPKTGSGTAAMPGAADANPGESDFDEALSPGELVWLIPQPDESLPRDSVAVEIEPPKVSSQSLAADLPPSGGGQESAAPPRWLDAVLRLTPWLWGAGTLGACGIQAVRILRFRRLLRKGQAAPPWLEEAVADAAALVGVRAPSALMTSAVCSPLVCAVGRARLIWPESLTEHLPQECRRAVVVHELAHLRRRDHWVGWLELVAGCGWWWNPLFWLVRQQLRENAELACDAWVVSVLPRGRRAYAQALIEVSQWVSWAPAPVPAMGMGSSARRTFERRLTMILRERVSYRMPLAGLALVGILTLAVLPGWSTGQDAPASNDQAPAATAEVTLEPALDPVAGQPAVAEPRPTDTFSAQPAAPTAGTESFQPATADGAQSTVDREIRSVVQIDGMRREVVVVQPAGDRESQLRSVEARLEQLLAEVRSLHAQRQAGTAATVYPAPRAVRTRLGYTVQVRPSAQANVVTLTRATYTLPQAQAEALAAFIKEHVTADVEAKVDGDKVTITAAPDVQQHIGQFIGLLQPAEAQPADGASFQNVPVRVPVVSSTPPANPAAADPFGQSVPAGVSAEFQNVPVQVPVVSSTPPANPAAADPFGQSVPAEVSAEPAGKP